MTTLSPLSHTGDGLGPVTSALLARARADADRVRGEAEDAAAQTLASAQAEADALVGAARDEAREQARTLRAAQEAHGRRKAREVELAARRAAYDTLVDEAHGAVRSILEDSEVIDVLTAVARRQEGPGTHVTRTDDGVVVEGRGRRVEFSLTALADEAIAEVLRARSAARGAP